MAGIELIISTVCNATFCKVPYNDSFKGPDLHSSYDIYYKNLMEEVNGKTLKIGTYNGKPYSLPTHPYRELQRTIPVKGVNSSRHLRQYYYYHIPRAFCQNTPLSWTVREKGKLLGRGVAFIIIDILSERFNFTYEIVEPKNNYEYGGKSPEDSLIGLLNTSKIDMAAAFLPSLLAYREKISYSIILDEGIWVMMLKRPKESAAGSGLLAPFNSLVWYLVLAAVVTFAPCITAFTLLRNKMITDDEGVLPLKPSFWFVYSAFLKQGTSLAPEANTTRVLFVTWWLFMILLSAFYTANLTAFLTLSKFTLAIEYPKDLYSKNYRWVSAAGSSVEYTVKTDGEDLSYLSAMVSNGRARFLTVRTDQDFLETVKRGSVLVKEQTVVDHLMYNDYISKKNVEESDRCTYVIAPNPFMKKQRAFAYPIGSHLKNLFDPVLTKIFQSGILDFLKSRDLPSTKICPLDLQSKDRKLRNSDLIMTYMVMGVGSGVAAAVFAAEVIAKRYLSIKIKGTKSKKISNSGSKSHHYDDTRPPPYESLFGKNSKYNVENTRTKMINGREYYVFDMGSGGKKLIPVRAPSSFLYRSDK